MRQEGGEGGGRGEAGSGVGERTKEMRGYGPLDNSPMLAGLVF